MYKCDYCDKQKYEAKSPPTVCKGGIICSECMHILSENFVEYVEREISIRQATTMLRVFSLKHSKEDKNNDSL